MEDKMQWFVVNVHTSCEDKVARELREQIDKRKLNAYFGEILVPTREVSEIKASDTDEDTLTTDHCRSTTDSSSFLLHNSSLDDNSSPDEVPPYVQILNRALERGKKDEEGSLTFTFDEIRYLASDENFARRFPVMAADIRKMRKQIDSS